jgi:predicted PurR-regulated permease PerM
MEEGSKSSRFRVEISWKTIIKVLLGVLLACIAVKLWPLFKLLAIAILLAVALHRIVSWTCGKGWPRWAGVLLASAILVVAVVGLFGVIGPMAFRQASAIGKDLPRLKEQVVSHLPQAGPLHDVLQTAVNSGTGTDSSRLLQKGLTAVQTTLGGLLDLIMVVAFAIYLMADGPRALRWLIAFFPRERRPPVSEGLAQIGDRIVAYVAGQAITSILFAVYVFFLLSILHVPMALVLAILAAVFDVLPVVGIFLAVLPAVLMGLTVSPTTALLVAVCYGAYHLIEDYVIIPRVYGHKLKLSTLAVLLAITVGYLLAGVIGAVALLPLVAAYPALERLWLRPTLEPEVMEEHAKLRAA